MLWETAEHDGMEEEKRGGRGRRGREVKHAYTQSLLLGILSGLFVLLHGSLPSFSPCPFFRPFNSNQRGQERCWEKEGEIEGEGEGEGGGLKRGG